LPKLWESASEVTSPAIDFLSVVIALFVVVSAALALVVWRLMDTRAKVSVGSESCPWTLGDVMTVFGLGGWLTLMLLAPDVAVSGLTREGTLSISAAPLARMVLIQNVVLALTCFLWLRVRRGVSLSRLGLTDVDWRRRMRAGLKAGFAVWLLAEIAVRLTRAAAPRVFSPETLQVLTSMESSTTLLQAILPTVSVGGLVVFVILVGLVAPLVEEVLFRGFAYPAMKARWGSRWGMAVSGAFFAAAHLTLLDFPALCVVGVFLAWLYEETGSLVAPYTAHAVNNVLTVVVLAFFGQGAV